VTIKFYIYGALALALLGSGAAVMIYKAKAETAVIKQEVAEQQRDTMMQVNKQILAAQAEDAKLRETIYADFKAARTETETYRQKLAKHDLSALAATKPGLVTRLARRATVRVLRDIEAAVNNPTDKTLPVSAPRRHGEAETSPADSHDN